MSQSVVHNFAGRFAVVLHRSDEIGQRIRDRCDRLGIRVGLCTGDLGAVRAEGANMIILDIDMADDGQLPWPPGQAPIPIVGLVGSESPGRLAWALNYGVDAYLPLSALGNLFSALVIAHEHFAQKADRRRLEDEMAERRSGQLDVIRAVLTLMKETGDEALALKQLRAMAMVERISLEQAARQLLREPPRRQEGGR